MVKKLNIDMNSSILNISTGNNRATTTTHSVLAMLLETRYLYWSLLCIDDFFVHNFIT